MGNHQTDEHRKLTNSRKGLTYSLHDHSTKKRPPKYMSSSKLGLPYAARGSAYQCSPDQKLLTVITLINYPSNVVYFRI